MRRRHYWPMAALVMAGAAAWWIGDRTLQSVPSRETPHTAVVSESRLEAAVQPPPAVAATPPPDAAVRRYLAREEFQRRTREFFAQAPQLDPATRLRDARAIEAALDGYERDRELSAGEAMLLRTGLIRATIPDEAEQIERIADLTTRYRLDAERRLAAWAAHPDARLEEYKKRESAIVEEVMALAAIPGGLSRDEYLRLRLQREREAVYAGVH